MGSKHSPTTVLFIDDDPADLELWSDRLRECSPQYTVLKAETVKAGLNACEDQRIDCVVLDLDLSDSSGFEALLSLVPDRKSPPIAVVVLTRLLTPNLHEMALHNGAKACLVKQFTSAEQLHEAIQKAVASIAS